MSNFGGFLGKLAQQFDIFGLMDDENTGKDKKKKAKLDFDLLIFYYRGAQVESDTMNINESFLKQANILKKILSKYLQEGDNADLEIRLEICDILN